jgi:hypothetical protein
MRSQILPEWIAMFNEEELQMLISGRTEEGFDVEDLRRHTQYASELVGHSRKSRAGCLATLSSVVIRVGQ